MDNKKDDDGGTGKKKHFKKANPDDPLVLPKSTAGKQRLQIEKLMRNPEKPVFIPERKRDWKPRTAPEFVRDVMGSSAGAGSGEFHVYRGYRRREIARQNYIQESGEKLDKDSLYHEQLEQNQKAADAKTAKKRAKRLKQKQRMQAKKKKTEEAEKKAKKKAEGGDEESDEESEDDDDDNDSDEKDDDANENCFVIGGK